MFSVAISALPVGSLFAQTLPLDPPARVGRVGELKGTVSFHLADADRWDAAMPNLPVTTGSAFWVEPNASAELGIERDRIVLDGATELDITRLDDQSLIANLPEGSAYLNVRDFAPGSAYTIQTPRGLISIVAVGRYEIVAGNTERPTTVSVIDGTVQLTSNNIALQLNANQTATIIGDGTSTPFRASVGAFQRDRFVTAMLASEQVPVRRTGAAPLPSSRK